MAGGFPNVPFAPGVPSIPRAPGTIPRQPELMTGDGPGIDLPSADPVQWGIFDSGGNPVVTAESVASFSYKQDWLIADYPIEQGAFETYNKVQVPFDVRVRYTAGGSDQNRQALLDSVAAAAKSMDLFDVYTPEKQFSSVSIQHFDFTRTARNGVGLVVVDVWCVEVRLLAAKTFSQTAQPSGATSQNGGVVQPSAATAVQKAPVAATTPATVEGQSGQWVSHGATGSW